jgi:hypothetical protein
MARPLGKCSVCGVTALLSYEHVPPRSAFNAARVFVGDSKRLFGPKSYEQYFSPKGIYDQKGAGGYTICENCNNNPGSWYVPSYLEWVVQGMRYLRAIPQGSSLSLPFKIKPLAVFKEVICMFAAHAATVCWTQSRNYVDSCSTGIAITYRQRSASIVVL